MEMAPADAAAAGAAKRKRDDEEAILEPAWFTADAQEKLRAEYAASGPYAHAVLSPLALDARLADVRGECASELKATFKETDLFKVFQVPHDLSALEDSAPAVAARVPSLLALRDALYGPRMRELIERDRMPAALGRAHRLLGQRVREGRPPAVPRRRGSARLASYIVYLTDPARPWSSASTAARQSCTPCAPSATRCSNPSPYRARVDPSWNSMLISPSNRGAVPLDQVRAPRAASAARLRAAGAPKNAPPPPAPSSRARHPRAQEVFSADCACPSRDGTTPDGVPPAARAGVAAAAPARRARADRVVSPFRGLTLQSDDERWADDGECGDGDDDDDDDDETTRPPRPPTWTRSARGQRGVPERRVAEQAPRALCGVDGGDDDEEDAGGDSAMQLHAFLRARLRSARAARGGARRGRRARQGPRVVGQRGRRSASAGDRTASTWQRYAVRPRPTSPGRPRAEEPPRLDRDIRGRPAARSRRLARGFARRRPARLLRRLTGVRVIGSSRCVRRFRPGLDYTVAHGGLDASEARLDLTPGAVGQRRRRREDWARGEVGGFGRPTSTRRTTTEVRARRRPSRATHRGGHMTERDTRRRGARARSAVACTRRGRRRAGAGAPPQRPAARRT